MKKLSAYLFGSIFLIYSCKETFQSEAVKKNISFWGDSMTAGSGGNGVTMPDVVKDELKRKVFNGGVAGLSSNNIACLQGGLDFIIKLKENKISSIGIDTLSYYNIIPYIHTTNQTRLGSINGIKGTLTRVGNLANPIVADCFYFTRATVGKEIIIPSEGVRMIFDDAVNHRNDLTVIWSGRNDPMLDNYIPTTIANISSMVSYLENNQKQFLIISVCNGNRQTEGVGSDVYSNIISLNNELHSTFGYNYVDLRKYMVEQAIYDAKITPTNEDLNDIASDCIPTSLRYDHVHFNENGYRMAGKYIANIIRNKDW
jgi:hypothetical protein